MTSAERRKHYLVEKKFQLKPVFLIAAAAIIIVGIIEWQIFMLLKTVLPEIAMMETRNEILRFGVFIMIQLFIIFALLAIFTTVHIHRLVGPLARLTRELDSMTETGNYKQLTLRKNDALKAFISTVNKILAKTQK